MEPGHKYYHAHEHYPAGVNNKFPWKLWRIVNECRTDAIRWSESGRTIIINKEMFQVEYLDSPSKVFKTTNIGSFIRQLNLYGFRKVQPACRHYPYDGTEDHPDIQEFYSENFKRDRPDLVNELKRHVGVRKAKDSVARKRFFDSIENQKVKAKKPFLVQDENACAPKAKIQKMPGAATGFSRPGPPVIGTLRPIQSDLHHQSYKAMIENKNPAVVAFPVIDANFMKGNDEAKNVKLPILLEWSNIQKKWVSTAAFEFAMMHRALQRTSAGGHLDDNPLQRLSRDEFHSLITTVTDAMQAMPEARQYEQFLETCDPYNFCYHFNPHDESPFLPVMRYDSDEDEGLEVIQYRPEEHNYVYGIHHHRMPMAIPPFIPSNPTIEFYENDGPFGPTAYELEVETAVSDDDDDDELFGENTKKMF